MTWQWRTVHHWLTNFQKANETTTKPKKEQLLSLSLSLCLEVNDLVSCLLEEPKNR